jgi:hypothetical protein
MGILTDGFNGDNLANWLNNYKKVDYQWKNPIDEILTKIKSIFEN